jgi:malonyl-CoA O-methyltransferase
MLHLRDIRRRFDRAASRFHDADFVHAQTRDGILARLDPLLLDARSILDLGSATGATGRMLRQRFRRAQVVALDLSHEMLVEARRKKAWLSRSSMVQADAARLPFADGAFDLVVANQLLPWAPDPQPIFVEVARVLKEGGVFAFATLGPDSLREIERAWASVDNAAHVNRFPDMHDIGDGLVRAGLSDPVLDIDRLAVSYSSPDRLFADLTAAGARNTLADRARGLLFADLTAAGARNTLADRARGLSGKAAFRAMRDALTAAGTDGNIVLDLELVFGHCWGAGAKIDPGNYRISADQIPRRRS